MKDKKNIDDLFKDSFKNFEANPSPDVWKHIQAKLKEEDNRKIIPLWVKLGGIAALLALIFTIGNSIVNPPIDPLKNPTPFVNENNHLENSLKNSDEIILKDKEIDKEVEVSNNQLNEELNLSKENEKKELINTSEKINQQKTIYSESTIASKTKSEVLEKSTSDKIIKESVITNSQKEVIAQNQKGVDEKPKESLIKNEFENNAEIINNTEAVTTNNKVNDSSIENSIIDNSELNKEENKKSIFDAINENSEEDIIVTTIDNTPDHRWEVTPNVAPVYYNTLSEGSSIDPSFSDNSKSGDLNIAYGVKVSYNLNKRLSVRSGVSNVNLSYSTTGLDIGTGPVSAATSSSIDYYGRNNVTIVVDKGALVNQNPENPFANVTPKSTNGEAYLNQKISYFEMPVELNYAIINKKFGVNVIGGFSTLLLGNNEVSVEAGDFNEVLGEASNLSSLSFTTNIGLGLNYSFSKKLMFNIEPMFKYQLNPYTDSSVNFKPYYIGVYSGLSFKF